MVRYAYGAWLVLAPCSLDVVEPGARSQASPALSSPSALAVALPSGLRCEGSDKKPPRARHIASNDTSRVRAIPITLVPTFMVGVVGVGVEVLPGKVIPIPLCSHPEEVATRDSVDPHFHVMMLSTRRLQLSSCPLMGMVHVRLR